MKRHVIIAATVMWIWASLSCVLAGDTPPPDRREIESNPETQRLLLEVVAALATIDRTNYQEWVQVQMHVATLMETAGQDRKNILREILCLMTYERERWAPGRGPDLRLIFAYFNFTRQEVVEVVKPYLETTDEHLLQGAVQILHGTVYGTWEKYHRSMLYDIEKAKETDGKSIQQSSSATLLADTSATAHAFYSSLDMPVTNLPPGCTRSDLSPVEKNPRPLIMSFGKGIKAFCEGVFPGLLDYTQVREMFVLSFKEIKEKNENNIGIYGWRLASQEAAEALLNKALARFATRKEHMKLWRYKDIVILLGSNDGVSDVCFHRFQEHVEKILSSNK
ncbi:MAG: hypothetical protein HYV35_03330 [Lentisphaerae bacterium]|nr:hypothetical protein [Lentisphaerota bacterium]